MLGSLVLAFGFATPSIAPDEHSSFGSIVARAGDFDADGVPDLILGEPGDGTYREPISLWVVSGRDGSVLCLPSLSQLGPASFGAHGGVDVDGDRIPDILVTSTLWDEPLPDSLRVVSGATGAVSIRILLAGPAWRGDASAHFVGDKDGDGLADVGALCLRAKPSRGELKIFSARSGVRIETIPLANEGSAACGGFVETTDLDGDGARDFAVLLAGGDGTVGTLRLYSTKNRIPLWEHPAPDRSHESHAPLIVLGDVDGDGVDDLAAGFLDRVDVVSGRTGSLLYHLAPDEKPGAEWGFGCGLAATSDIDGDRIPDFVVAETEAGSFFEGALLAYSGRSGQLLWRTADFDGNEEVWHFGIPLVAVGDVDGDGVTDLLAGSNQGMSGTRGFAALISGRDGKLLRSFRRRDLE